MAKDPSVQSIIVPRPTVDTSEFAGQGAKTFARVAGGFADFFGQQLDRAVQAEQDQIEAINEATLQRMELVVQSDLKAAREASRTGDFSRFANVEQMKQKFFQVNVPKLLGRSLAINDRAEYETALNDLGANENATEFTAKFFAEKTKDMNPFAQAEYLRATDKFAPGLIKQREKTLANTASLASKEKIPVLLRDGFATGAITNLKQFNQFIARHTAADPGNFSEEYLKYRDLYDRELARIATDADNPASLRAMQMIQAKDPERDGTSVVDRLGADIDKIVNENIAKSQRIFSTKAQAVLDEANVRITKLETGVGGSDTLAKVQEDLVRGFTDYGSLANPKFLKTYTRWLKAVAKTGVVNSAKNNFVATGVVSGSKKDQEAVYRALLAEGNNEKATEFLQVAGAPNSVKADWAARLRSGDLSAVAEIKTAHVSLPIENYLDDGPEMAIYVAASSADGPEEAAERIAKIQQNLQQSGQKFRGHFARRFNVGQPSVDGRSSGTGGIRSVNQMVRNWLGELSDEQMASLGFPEGTDVKSLSPSVINRLSSLLDAASVATSDRPIMDETAVMGELLNYAKGEFEMLPDTEGNMRIYVRSTPKYVIDAAGKKVTSKAFDETTGAGWEEHKENAHIKNTPLAGLRSDARTRVDGSAAVTVTDLAGTEQDYSLAITRPDRPTEVDLELVQPGGLLDGAFTVISTDEEAGTAVIQVDPPGGVDLDPDAPAQGNTINLDDRLQLQYDPASTTWRMRYIDRGLDDERNFLQKASDLLGLTGNRDDIQASLQDLTDTQRSAVMREKARFDPRTWTNTELRRRALGAPGSPEIAKEIKRRRDGGKRIPVEGVAETRPGTATNAEAAPLTVTSDEEATEVENLVDDMFGSGVTRGHFKADAVKAAKNSGLEPTQQVLEANMKSMVNGHFFDNLDEPEGKHFMTRFAKFIEHSEGFEAFVYSDEGGGVQALRWKPGMKGNPTVGIGFNLRRPDADAILAQAGAPKMAKLLKGEATVSHEQAVKIMEIANQKNMQFLRKHFDGIMMEKHRWMALLSLVYNSRWKNNKPTLIGPKITAAIREGRWEDAAWEIEFNSSGGVSKANQKGINARRRREAAMFRGAEL